MELLNDLGKTLEGIARQVEKSQGNLAGRKAECRNSQTGRSHTQAA